MLACTLSWRKPLMALFGIVALGGIAGAQASSITAQPVVPTPAITQDDADGAAKYVSDPASLLPDLPPLPSTRVTLIGGTIQHLDRLRDRMTIAVFGGGRMTILFDPRTQVFLGNALASTDSLRQGAIVHFDTILDGGQIFAKSIRVGTLGTPGEMEGVLLRYRADQGELTVRDALSPNPIRLRLLPSTRVTMNGKAIAAAELTPGTLLAIKFDPNSKGRDTASEISLLALPGVGYTFTGRLVDLDLSSGLLVLESATDGKRYEVYLQSSTAAADKLHPGALVTIKAAYEGSRYVAQNVDVDSQNK